jgi:hypothetical protein
MRCAACARASSNCVARWACSPRQAWPSTRASSPISTKLTRNLELLWLLGRLVPDHKTIADFRKDYADCGYFNSPEILECHEAGITVTRQD